MSNLIASIIFGYIVHLIVKKCTVAFLQKQQKIGTFPGLYYVTYCYIISHSYFPYTISVTKTILYNTIN